MIPGIYNWLTNDAGVAALVGTSVYPNVIPEGKDGPAIVYQLIDGHPENYLSENPNIDRGVFQITSWSKEPTKARDAFKAAIVALQTFGNIIGGQSSDYDPDTKMHGFRFEFSVWDYR